MIGILGGTGEVGRSAAAMLSAHDLRLGSRATGVDVTDEESLGRFVEGCTVIVNCVGPSHQHSAAVAKAALRADVDLVDAGGDEHLRAALDDEARKAGRRIVLAAGALPGLSGLLPRWLAAGLGAIDDLTAYFAVADRFTKAAAEDYLEGVLGNDNEPLAAWRNARAIPDAVHRQHNLTLPYLTDPVSAFPFLDGESRQLARDLNLTNGTWYSVIEGDHLVSALDRARGLTRAEAVDGVCRAAALDLAGRTARTTFLVEARHAVRTRTAVLRGPGISTLTGAIAGITLSAINDVPPGAWCAANVLDPIATIDRLRPIARVFALEAAIEGLVVVEEGAL